MKAPMPTTMAAPGVSGAIAARMALTLAVSMLALAHFLSRPRPSRSSPRWTLRSSTWWTSESCGDISS